MEKQVTWLSKWKTREKDEPDDLKESSHVRSVEGQGRECGESFEHTPNVSHETPKYLYDVPFSCGMVQVHIREARPPYFGSRVFFQTHMEREGAERVNADVEQEFKTQSHEALPLVSCFDSSIVLASPLIYTR